MQEQKPPFEVVGPIEDVQTIASGRGIRNLRRLVRAYGIGRWRKRKGIAMVRLRDGSSIHAEVHWYEATGIGKREMKLKRILERP